MKQQARCHPVGSDHEVNEQQYLYKRCQNPLKLLRMMMTTSAFAETSTFYFAYSQRPVSYGKRQPHNPETHYR
jgi:hypothetical protein